MISARGGAGLGDSIYLRVVCDELARRGQQVTACSDYPDLFIGSSVGVAPFRRDRIDVVAHYVGGKMNPYTSQWRDVCDRAGVGDLPLRLPWQVRNQDLVDNVAQAAGSRPVVLVHGGRVPMGRTDGFGRELLPQKAAFDAALGALAGRCYRVRVGRNDQQVYPLDCDGELPHTSVADLLDLALTCDAIVAQCSFAVPLAEVFDRPLLAIWSAAGLTAREPYIRAIKPEKILAKPTSTFVVDDWPAERIQEAARALCHL